MSEVRPVAGIRIFEVGPRDGLQNESSPVCLEAKVAFVRALIDAGHSDIEVTSFVRAERIPQLADGDELFAALPKTSPARLWALIPNEKGYERARALQVRHIAVFTAASNTFNQKNINTDISGSLDRIKSVVDAAKRDGCRVRAYVSCALGCPYEGTIVPARVLDVVRRLEGMGCEDFSIGDTIGVGTPVQVRALLDALLREVPTERLAMHFHDTRGTALVNVWESMSMGVFQFDSSAGGLGGCPYAPGAAGNLATEDLLYLIQESGRSTPVQLARQAEASRIIQRATGCVLPSRVLMAMNGPAADTHPGSRVS